ncbi:MAG: ASCH domain-containing protein [Candidatus Saccharibacteria bacterium]|nr:ASCH domain-containing protein [Candidatus Saccharibacteria bacterium]
MKYGMQLLDEYFRKMKSGEKRIEFRLYDEKRRKIRIGDSIEFSNLSTNEKMEARVVGLLIYKDFSTMFSDLGMVDDGTMDELYDPLAQRKFGVMGIRVEVME